MSPAPAATPVVADLAQRVATALAAGRPPATPLVVALDGRSGAGKSTLAAALVREAGSRCGVAITSIALESLYPGWTGLAAGTRVWAQELLPRLADGRPVTYRPWDWEAHRAGPPVTAPPAPIVVAEGVGAGVREARARLDLLIWVAAPPDVRRERALARDRDVFAPWWDAWASQEDGLLAADPILGHADLVVDASASDVARWRVVTPAWRQPR